MSAAVRAAATVAALAGLLLSSAASAQPVKEGPKGAAAAAEPPASAAMRVAVLDIQKVLRETEEGMRIESNLRKLFDAKQADLLGKEKQLSQEYEELQKEEKSKGGKADAGLQKKLAEFKQKYAAYTQLAQEFQRDFARKQNELYNPMIQKVGTIVKGIAQVDGFDLVVEKQAAVYFRRDLEITEKVIQAYNAGDPTGAAPKPKTPKKAPPAPAPKP